MGVIEHGGFYPAKKIYEEGDVVHFFCEENYSFHEFDLIQCYYFGWYPDPPVCEGTLIFTFVICKILPRFHEMKCLLYEHKIKISSCTSFTT